MSARDSAVRREAQSAVESAVESAAWLAAREAVEPDVWELGWSRGGLVVYSAVCQAVDMVVYDAVKQQTRKGSK